MSSGNPVIGIEIEAKIDNFRRGMESLPGITSAQVRAATEAYARQLRTATNASRAAGEAAQRASVSIQSLGGAAGKVGGSVQKLSGALDAVVPGLGSAVGGLADYADVGEVAAEVSEAIGLSLGKAALLFGAVAAVAATVAIAYTVHARNAEIAADREALLARESEVLLGATDKLEDAQLRLAVALGRVTGASAQNIQSKRDATRAVEALARSQADEREEAEEALVWNGKVAQALETVGTAGNGLTRMWVGLADTIGGFSAKADAATLKIADLGDSFTDQVGKIHATADANEKAAEATEAARKAAEAHARALAEEAAAFDRLVEAAARENARVATLTGGIQELLDQAEATDAGRLQGMAKIDAAHEKVLKGIAEEKIGLLLLAKTDVEREMAGNAAATARAAEMEAYAEAVEQEAATAEAAYQKRVDAFTAAEKARVDAARAADAAIADSAEGLFSLVADASGLASERMSEKNKAAALAFFNVQKAAAIGQATMATYNAAAQALAIPPAPNLVAAGLAAGAGAIHIAGIAATPAPSFDDTPQMMVANKGRTNVSLKDGDHFVAAQNPADLAAQVGGAGVTYNVFKLGHRILDVQLAQNLRAGGTLSRVQSAGGRVGHSRRQTRSTSGG